MIITICLNSSNESVRVFTGGRGWIWGGCSDNVEFGENISKQFVDALENGHDSRAAVNLHNNEAGRHVSINKIKIYIVLDNISIVE